MKRATVLAISVIAALGLLPVGAQPQGPAGPVDLKFGAMPIGSAWYVYAATLTKLFESSFPKGSSFEVIPQGGGIANPLMVAQGKAQVALTNTVSARWAYDGIEMYKGKQATNIRAIAGGLTDIWFAFMIRKEYIQKTGQNTLKKMIDAKAPIRLILKPEGSIVPPLCRFVLAEYGVTFDTIKSWGGQIIQVSGGQIPSMMREGRADVWFESVITGHPATVEGMMTANLEMIGIEDSVIRNMLKYGVAEDVIPANSFPNQPRELKTVNPGTMIIANESLPENVAYLITKTLCENKPTLVAAHASINDFEPDKAWMPDRVGVPLHPGAARYYREKGWMK